MSQKSSRRTINNVNLHEVARLSREEIDCLLNPNDDIEIISNCDDKESLDATFATRFAKAFSFYLSIQLGSDLAVDVIQTSKGNFRKTLVSENKNFTTMLFHNRLRKVVAALLVCPRFQAEQIDSNTEKSAPDSDTLVSNSDDGNALNSLSSVSALMGRGLSSVSSASIENTADYPIYEGEASIVALQISMLKATYPSIALFSLPEV